MREKTVQIVVRLENTVYADLMDAADQLIESPNVVIARAIEEFLDRRLPFDDE